MWQEFREFISRGNVVDLAVAVVIGGAFGAIVNSFVDDIVMPLVGVLLGGIDFSQLSFTVGEAQVLYGNFIQAIVNFLIIAAAIFIAMRSYNKLRKQEEPEPEPPQVSDEVKVLIEIRDLLSEQGETHSAVSN
jgi:large conductance mechanosensitive channel